MPLCTTRDLQLSVALTLFWCRAERTPEVHRFNSGGVLWNSGFGDYHGTIYMPHPIQPFTFFPFSLLSVPPYLPHTVCLHNDSVGQPILYYFPFTTIWSSTRHIPLPIAPPCFPTIIFFVVGEQVCVFLLHLTYQSNISSLLLVNSCLGPY